MSASPTPASSVDQPQWVPRSKTYTEDIKSRQLPFVQVKEHPLQPPASAPPASSKKEAAPAPKKEVAYDPLSNPLDPLSEGFMHPLLEDFVPPPIAGISKSSSVIPTSPLGLVPVEDDVPGWDSKKAAIWAKYTTNESISVPSFVSGVNPKGANAPVDRVKNRLEQLDQFEEEDGEMLQLTQKEYQRHIEKKRDELIKAWDKEKRVKALKTAIKCAKLLGETEKVTRFYPSKFVLITEILDTFGELVFDRIKRRSTIYDDDVAIPLKDNFRAEDVADHAQETCKNWFYKIASIRELLPRIYVEMAIVQSYRFIENDTFPKIFNRISKMIRGIGDPLVSQYARAYLARKGREVLRSQKDYLVSGLEDYMFTEKLFDSDKMKLHMEARGMDKKGYLDLFCPALDWTMECISYKADPSLLERVLKIYGDCNNGFLLNSILMSFQPALIARHSLDFVNLIKKSSEETMDKLSLYRALGNSIVACRPRDDHRLKILNEIWKDVTKETNVSKYIEVAEVFIGYPLAHLSFKEADILLKDILDHVNVDKQYFEYQTHLESIMQKILSHSKADFHAIFSMKNFLPFLDLFRGETQTTVNKALLNTFNKTSGTVSDMIVMNTMLSVAKTVHDSITALSFDDEKREISQLLCTFMQKLDFGKDLEKQLNFYVEARRAFTNLDPVKVDLVKGVCHLAVRTQQFVKGKLNKQTSAFVRACIAFCFITIPSIELLFERLYLFALAAEIAMLNQSLPQAESLLKSAIQLVREVPKNIEERDGKATPTAADLVAYLKYFLSLLVAVPGHPDHGPFYLLKGFKTVVKEYEWDARGTQRLQLYTSILQCVAAIYQKKQPYEWDKVESNLVLFGYTNSYINTCNSFISEVLTDIKEEFTRLSDYQDGLSRSAHSQAALDLLYVTVANTIVTTNSIPFIVDHFKIAKKSTPSDKLQQLIDYIKTVGLNSSSSPTSISSTTTNDQSSLNYQKLLKVLEDIKNQKQ